MTAKFERETMTIINVSTNSENRMGTNMSSLPNEPLWAFDYVPFPLSGYAMWQVTLLTTLVVLLIVLIVGGNVVVMLAVVNDRRLRRQRQHWLIVSLATADLLVGLLVMPLTITFELAGRWIMGEVLCEVWLAMDVLFVTASILNLSAISLDRYWSVMRPLGYPRQRTAPRMLAIIGVTWGLSLMVSLPPLIGFRRERQPQRCELSSDVTYVLYSAGLSFYVPLTVLAVAYARIYQITRQHLRKRLNDVRTADDTLVKFSRTASSVTTPALNAGRALPHTHHQKLSLSNLTLRATSDRSTTMHQARCSIQSDNCVRCTVGMLSAHTYGTAAPGRMLQNVTYRRGEATPATELIPNQPDESPLSSVVLKRKAPAAASSEAMASLTHEFASKLKLRKKLLKAKERQAVLLLGLILTSFAACWLPFFLLYSASAFGVRLVSVGVFKVCFWAGYCNSAVNPILYTVFNQDFRTAIVRQLRRADRCLPSCVRRKTRHENHFY